MIFLRRYKIFSVGAVAAVAFGCLPSLHTIAHAQDYPIRPITIVVPFASGGGVDAMARVLAEKLRVDLKQPVIVDNKPGASGMLGAAAVVKAAPDGYTLLLGSAGETAINPFVFKGRMQYQPATDLAPISLIARVPNLLIASPNLPAKNVAELIAYAQKNPGKLTYASSGVGNPQHLNGELLKAMAKIHMTHIPYKGASAQMVDVASGNVDLTFVSMAGASSFLKAGRVKALAVTSAKRTGFAPDVPAIAEFKPMAAYNLENWFGLFAPAATPQALQLKINEAFTQALRDPEVAKRLQEQGGEVTTMSTTQFAAFVKAEAAKYARIVEAAQINAE
jgi:tripartite-type tricarboxylate transporter receptor subunit TctC